MDNMLIQPTKSCSVKSGFMPGGDPWSGLAGAVMIQAVRDVRKDGALRWEASQWLLTEGYEWLGPAGFIGLDMSYERWASWVKAGCPDGWSR